MGATIDIDTGGTFTDGYVTLGSRTVRVKVETTPHDFTECFLRCLEEAAAQLEVPSAERLLVDTDVLRFSSTLATNTVIERSGPPVGVLVSHGHADDLYGDGTAELLYGNLLARELVAELQDPRDDHQVRAAVRRLLRAGARVVVVALAGSAEDASDERYVKAVHRAAYPRHYLGAVPCLLASEVTSRFGDARRLATAVVNAYLHPEMVRTLYKADEEVRQRAYPKPLLIAHASGGVARVAKTRAVETYNSGPAAGVHGGARMARHYDLPVAIGMDMGGTSTDVSVVKDGRVPPDPDPRIEDIPVSTSMVQVTAFGAGGNSVVSDTEAGLRVGPRSQGAVPGPAAYALGGTEATPTDAELVLGTFDPAYFLGGRRKLDAERARSAVASLRSDGDAEAAAVAVHQAVVDKLSQHLTAVLAEREVSPSSTSLFAFGGSGGVFGADVARAAGMSKVYSFVEGAVFSAFGLAGMDVSHVYELPEGATHDELLSELSAVRERAQLDMAGEGFPPEKLSYAIEAEVDDGVQHVPVEDGWEEPLKIALEAGARMLRLRVAAPVRAVEPERSALGDADPEPGRMGERRLVRPAGAVQAPVYDRAALVPGNVVDGPALIDDVHATSVVPEGCRLTIDEFGTGITEIGGS